MAVYSPEALLRLAGGLASVLVTLVGIIVCLVDLLSAVVNFNVFVAMHHSAACALLISCGVAGCFSEIRPLPMVHEHAPFLGQLHGRACLYCFLGMYVVWRPDVSQSWFNFLVGMYTAIVGALGSLYSMKYRGFSSGLSRSMGDPRSQEMHARPAMPPPHGASRPY
eukprot:gnl/MRDRNA2_/MRDRNA2_30722_c0_seq1.p1 gnl/MRDRNA2_/MRDRNA2_30722_c0~~gnl/MRDRNA2_/MRDRNA2_30722_c0_seq1.p1  ORF type:complete len:177 (-),score=20.77 gnl/MRDRNA2_/MRDRNA2_30722_c0_seq1:124-621(-)